MMRCVHLMLCMSTIKFSHISISYSFSQITIIVRQSTCVTYHYIIIKTVHVHVTILKQFKKYGNLDAQSRKLNFKTSHLSCILLNDSQKLSVAGVVREGG